MVTPSVVQRKRPSPDVQDGRMSTIRQDARAFVDLEVKCSAPKMSKYDFPGGKAKLGKPKNGLYKCD